ncbi:MAG TPA: glutaredoxin family protein [Burkholderiaceae bacterium]|nr:glutaredoxin family protein [Burkholderiaceae bacterium]
MSETTRRVAAQCWIFAAVAAAAFFLSSANAQYKWTDPDGKTVYGDNPPREARNVQRVDARGASGAADALAGLPYESRRAAQQFPVLLYTTANCQPCDSGRELLQARGIPYSERTISTKEDSDAMEKLGLGNHLPVMTVGRQVQREFETVAWHAVLDAAGYPRSAQLPRGWPVAPVPLAPRPAEAPSAPAGEAPRGADKTN